MVKKKLTMEEKEDKALNDILKFAKEHRETLKAVEKLKDNILDVKDLDKKLEDYKDYIRLCEAMLRREDEYLKKIASELGIRLDNKR